MTELERETLAEGFKLCLFGVGADSARDALQFHAVLFDGGRQAAAASWQGAYYHPEPEALDRLRHLLVNVLAPPHVLAVHGKGWAALLTQILPHTALAELRVLDLLKTAVALQKGLRSSAGMDQVTAAYGLRGTVAADSVASPVVEELLWALIASAGAAGLSWPALLAAAGGQGTPVAFERYAFGEEMLAALPAGPGVYVMYDAADRPIYVGKAANLARRLSDYFRATADLPEKVRRIRDRIRDFSFHRVGSELEALLLENKLIAEMEPDINVQRHVAEGRSRYGAPLICAAVVLPSVKPGCAELFLLGAHGRAWQCRVTPSRAPRQRLARMIRACLEPGNRRRGPRDMKDWGAVGNEIASRYFARFRDRLNWLELSGRQDALALTDATLGIVKLVLERPDESAEFRLSDDQ